MLQNDTRALARPQHIFDLAAVTANGLAAAGNIAIRLAYAIDRANNRGAEPSTDAVRPRDRLGPAPFERSEHGITDGAWRSR